MRTTVCLAFAEAYCSVGLSAEGCDSLAAAAAVAGLAAILVR